MWLYPIVQLPGIEDRVHQLKRRFMSQVPIVCPKCGGKVINATAKINSLDDLQGAVCSDCGREFTKDDVIAQAKKTAADIIRNALGKR
jgi:DNA-directed RNA polymerase subunit RPC12/RpoP